MTHDELTTHDTSSSRYLTAARVAVCRPFDEQSQTVGQHGSD